MTNDESRIPHERFAHDKREIPDRILADFFWPEGYLRNYARRRMEDDRNLRPRDILEEIPKAKAIWQTFGLSRGETAKLVASLFWRPEDRIYAGPN